MEVKEIRVTQRYHVKLKKDGDGYYAIQCVELPAAISQGKGKRDAIRNIKEAIALVVEVLADEYRKNTRKVLANRRRRRLRSKSERASRFLLKFMARKRAGRERLIRAAASWFAEA